MAHKYKGKDRLLITQGKRLLATIMLRDLRALNPKKTTSLSTRSLILDNPTGGSHPLHDAAVLLMNQFTSELAM